MTAAGSDQADHEAELEAETLLLVVEALVDEALFQSAQVELVGSAFLLVVVDDHSPHVELVASAFFEVVVVLELPQLFHSPSSRL